MGRFRGRLRKLEREMETGYVTVEHEDGTVSRWSLGDNLFKEVFLYETERGAGTSTEGIPDPRIPSSWRSARRRISRR